MTLLNHTTQHHNGFIALFPGPPGWGGARRELLDFMVQGKINRGRHTDHPAGRHSKWTNQCPSPPSPIFYRPDALPSAQPTVSEYWRQLNVTLLILHTNLHVTPIAAEVPSCWHCNQPVAINWLLDASAAVPWTMLVLSVLPVKQCGTHCTKSEQLKMLCQSSLDRTRKRTHLLVLER